MRAPRNSLTTRVTRSVMVAVVVGWGLVSVGVGLYVRYEINEGLDSALVDSAHRLLDLAIHDIEAPLLKAPTTSAVPARVAPHTTIVEEGDPSVIDHYHVYQVLDTQGRLLLRSRNAPEQALVPSRQAGFVNNDSWRVYIYHHPKKPFVILMGDSTEHRREAATETITWLLLAMLVALPLLAWGIRFQLQRALQVVSRLATDISERGSTRLDPIPDSQLPDELKAITTSTNRLLARLGDSLAIEKSLASNAAHELRTPLATVQMRLHTLMSLPLSDEAQFELGSALASLDQLTRRAERLLQMSKAESQAWFEQDIVDLGQLAAAVVQEFWAQQGASDQLSLHIESDTPVQVKGDQDALAIALRNLIDNALKYAQGAPIQVMVTTPACLCVQDEGPGTGAKGLESIFQRHARGSQRVEGFGLGLSIVNTIVEKHKGRLSLCSPLEGEHHGFRATLHFQALEP